MFFHGMKGTNLVETFPVPINRDTLERGRQRFDAFCSPCHGFTGEGTAWSCSADFRFRPFHLERRPSAGGTFLRRDHAWLRNHAAVRFARHPEDRWAIAAYIRVLQTSQNVPVTSLTPDERAKLEVAK